MTADVHEYLKELREKLLERNLADFWVMADRADFKPLKKTKKEIDQMLEEKGAYYKKKRIARIHCYVNPDNLKDPAMFVMSVKVVVMEITEEGTIDRKPASSYGLCINFYKEDLEHIKFSLKLVEALLRLVSAKKKDRIETDVINGIPYEVLRKRLSAKGIPWELEN